MKINVFGRSEHREALDIEASTASLELDDLGGVSFTKPIRVSLVVRRSVETAYIDGVAESDVEIECARCLVPFQCHVSGDFTLVIKQLREGAVVSSDDDDEDDSDALHLVSHDVIEVDIAPYVRDAVILGVPMKPVCRDDCRGLCPQCGRNLNDGDCGCSSETVDPRWGALRDVRDDLGDEDA